jgi:hypothetical protein
MMRAFCFSPRCVVPMKSVSALALAAVLAAGLAPSAFAAGDKLQLGAFGTGKASGPLLTRAELRECFAILDRVKLGNESAASEREQLQKEKDELVRQGSELKAQLDTLDRTSQEAIDQYKAKVTARDAAIGDWETRSNAFNAKVEAMGADRASFAKRCDNRRFDELDASAVRKTK